MIRARPLPLRPSGRPQAPAGLDRRRPARHRAVRARRSKAWVRQRLHLRRLLGRRQPAGRAQRRRRGRARGRRSAPARRCDRRGARAMAGHAELVDAATAGARRCAARALVNAAGPWVSQLPAASALGVDAGEAGAAGQGQPHRRAAAATRASTPTSCRTTTSGSCSRSPSRSGSRLIGTTDVAYEGEPRRGRAITAEETDYLCRVVNRYFRHADLARRTSSGPTAGVRPLYDDALGRPLGRHPRLRLRPRHASDGGAAAALGLRRQAHDLPQARRARAGEAAAGAGLHGRGLDRPRRTLPGRRPPGARPRGLHRRARAAASLAARRARPPLRARLRHPGASVIGERPRPARSGRGRRRRPARGRAALSRGARVGAQPEDVLWRRSSPRPPRRAGGRARRSPRWLDATREAPAA